MYYADKIGILKDIFGANKLHLETDSLVVDGKSYPIIEDVIVILDTGQYPLSLKKRLKKEEKVEQNRVDFASDIQFTFGSEWQKFSEILPEHDEEFQRYFDLIDVNSLLNSRVLDLGCGIGRWSYFLKDRCKELILLDFSESIFVARRNLAEAKNAIFFMGDLMHLPFRDDFADFIFSLGVLHHLPTNGLNEVRRLGRFSPYLLIYLYYSLDNRPIYFRVLLSMVTLIRNLVSKIRNPLFRSIFTYLVALLVYTPLIWLGKVVKPLGFSSRIPLYDTYCDKGLKRISQDVYDRFFTGIEQRFSKKEILTLKDTFSSVVVSEHLPYWHFICKR
jgi:SAM-dependent methyltransferase